MKKSSKKVGTVIIVCLLFSYTAAGNDGISLLKSENHSIGFHQALLRSESSSEVSIQTIQREKPVKAKAFFLSLAVPGLGEYYAGSKKMGTIFLCAEIALWTGYFAFQTYGDWKKSDYKQYAMAHAGIQSKGKNHQYFVNIEHYDHIRAYNEAKLQQREPEAVYPENEEYAWHWDQTGSRLKYEQMRVSSDRAYSGAVLMIGAIVVNHIVSSIDAIRVVRKVHKNSVQVGLRGRREGGMDLCISKTF